jgi:hypothetical protein
MGFFFNFFKETPPWGFDQLSFKHLEHGVILTLSWFYWGETNEAINLPANLSS